MPTPPPMVRRLIAVPVVLAGAVAVAFAANPAWARSAGLDVWNVSELSRQKEELAERHEELTAVDTDICRRIGAKEAVVRELIAGRTDLARATAEFVALNQPNPEYMRVIRETFPGSSDEEKMARNVIAYTLPRVENPGARARLARQLETELRALVNGQAPAAE